MKTAVSISDETYEAAEQLASELGWTRSRLYDEALRAYIEQAQIDDPLTAALVAIATTGPGEPVNVGRQSIEAGNWEW